MFVEEDRRLQAAVIGRRKSKAFCCCTVQLFRGNSDNSSLEVRDLWQPISARYVRLLPADWHGDTACMRADLVGCLDQLETSP